MFENFQSIKINGMNFNARCLLCGDSAKNPRKRRFNLKYSPETGGVFNCFNCGESGSFISLYSRIKGISGVDASRELKKQSFNSIKEDWKKKKKDPDEESISQGFFNHLKKEWITIDSKTSGIVQREYQARLKDFLYKRRLPNPHQFYIAWDGFYKSRIIVPIVDMRGNIIYFQARSLEINPDQKYINPDLSSKKLIIMNEYKFSRDKYIVITEGIFDACIVGDQGTCCFGSSISDDFLKKLKELTDCGIVIALDNDVTGKRSISSLITKSRYAKNLLYFKMPFPEIKDINQMIIERKIGNVYELVIKNSLTYLDFVVREKIGLN
jgi:DNA primase